MFDWCFSRQALDIRIFKCLNRIRVSNFKLANRVLELFKLRERIEKLFDVNQFCARTSRTLEPFWNCSRCHGDQPFERSPRVHEPLVALRTVLVLAVRASDCSSSNFDTLHLRDTNYDELELFKCAISSHMFANAQPSTTAT